MNGELKDMEAFEAAMAEAGYHAPKRSPHNDGYFFDRDQDRYIGFKLARPTPAPGALPELPEPLAWVVEVDFSGHRPNGLFAFTNEDEANAYFVWRQGSCNQPTLHKMVTTEQARAYAEQCRAGVVVTDAMVERSARKVCEIAMQDWDDIGPFAQSVLMDTQRAALQSAFADDEGVK